MRWIVKEPPGFCGHVDSDTVYSFTLHALIWPIVASQCTHIHLSFQHYSVNSPDTGFVEHKVKWPVTFGSSPCSLYSQKFVWQNSGYGAVWNRPVSELHGKVWGIKHPNSLYRICYQSQLCSKLSNSSNGIETANKGSKIYKIRHTCDPEQQGSTNAIKKDAAMTDSPRQILNYIHAMK